MMGPSISSDSALPATSSDVLVKARETLTEENWVGWVFCLLLVLGGGFKYFLFSSLFGEDSQFD